MIKPKTRKSTKPLYTFEHVEMGRGKVIYPVKPKPQTTIVHVAVTTAGPVPMKSVRLWLASRFSPVRLKDFRGFLMPNGDLVPLVRVTVKHDANRER